MPKFRVVIMFSWKLNLLFFISLLYSHEAGVLQYIKELEVQTFYWMEMLDIVGMLSHILVAKTLVLVREDLIKDNT